MIKNVLVNADIAVAASYTSPLLGWTYHGDWGLTYTEERSDGYQIPLRMQSRPVWKNLYAITSAEWYELLSFVEYEDMVVLQDGGVESVIDFTRVTSPQGDSIILSVRGLFKEMTTHATCLRKELL